MTIVRSHFLLSFYSERDAARLSGTIVRSTLSDNQWPLWMNVFLSLFHFCIPLMDAWCPNADAVTGSAGESTHSLTHSTIEPSHSYSLTLSHDCYTWPKYVSTTVGISWECSPSLSRYLLRWVYCTPGRCNSVIVFAPNLSLSLDGKWLAHK